MKTTLLLCASLFCFVSWAQTVNLTTQPGGFRVGESQIAGYSCVLPFEDLEVQRSLLRYLREYGRTEKIDDYFLSTDIELISDEGGEAMLFAKVEAIGLRSKVWLGLDTAGMGSPGYQILEETLEKLLLNFGRSLHVENLQSKIDAAESEAAVKGREYQKLINQQAILERKLSFNLAERNRLLEALEMNKAEETSLLERRELNTKLQKRTSEELHGKNKRVEQLRTELGNFQGSF